MSCIIHHRPVKSLAHLALSQQSINDQDCPHTVPLPSNAKATSRAFLRDDFPCQGAPLDNSFRRHISTQKQRTSVTSSCQRNKAPTILDICSGALKTPGKHHISKADWSASCPHKPEPDTTQEEGVFHHCPSTCRTNAILQTCCHL